MSTNYYLHSTDFPESVHIGASAGDVWTTDTSMAAQGEPLGWKTTSGMAACLAVQASQQSRFPAWVSDEYGRILTPAEAEELIMAHRVHREHDCPFT